jgi:dodecin
MRNLDMSIAKIIELTSESETSFEDAIQQGIDGATETLRGVKSAWIKEQEVVIEDDMVQAYRVTMKVTFLLERDEDEEEEEEEDGEEEAQ